ncbi:hypothetical protein GGR51DRAFT_514141 [Nemania sp. FL0031]|nr:hypothetical protein GGR51DRAFT_514141 [Nemania sp. FL0031]
MMGLIPLWYRMKWAGRRVIKLRMHAVRVEARLKREQKMVVAASQSRVKSGNGLYQDDAAPTTVGAKIKADDEFEAAIDNSAVVVVRTGAPPDSSTVKHALLAQYYPRVHTLRAWVLEKLQTTSRPQQRKFASVGLLAGANDLERDLGYLLDTTLVAEAYGDSETGRVI